MLKNKIKIILCSVILGSSIIGFYQPMVRAAPEQEEMLTEVQQLDNELSNLTIKLNDNNSKNVKLNNEIKINEKNIKDKEKEIKETESMLNMQIRNYYIENNDNSIITFLLSSKNMSEFLNKAKIMKIVLEDGNSTVELLENTKKELVINKKKLIENKKLIEKNNNEIKNNIKNIDDKKKELSAKLTELKELKDTKNITTFEQNQKMYEEFLKNNPDIATKGGTGNSIVNLAANFLGVKYVWGGTTPQGFDCSGLVQYCYAAHGISLPRTSQDQQQIGVDVPLSQAKAGDLVFFHGYPATHVGIYMGNGYYIHAPHTGDVVKISPLGSYTNIKKIIP